MLNTSRFFLPLPIAFGIVKEYTKNMNTLFDTQLDLPTKAPWTAFTSIFCNGCNEKLPFIYRQYGKQRCLGCLSIDRKIVLEVFA